MKHGWYTKECEMSTRLEVDINKREEASVVSLENLSELSGVPLDYIKSELMLDGDTVDLKELRTKMLGSIDSTFFKEA